jgi:hypothetical protein
MILGIGPKNKSPKYFQNTIGSESDLENGGCEKEETNISFKKRLWIIFKRKSIKILRPIDRPKTLIEVFWPHNAGFLLKMTNLLIVALLIAAIVIKTAKADAILTTSKYSEILNSIDNSKASYFWDEPRYPEILQLPDDLLDSFVRRRKPTFSRFESDLLFSKMARDDNYTYTIYVDFEYSSKNFKLCILSKDNNKTLIRAKLCRDKIIICLGKREPSEVEANDLKVCIDKSKECGSMQELDHGKSIDIKYCEKLYGRKL